METGMDGNRSGGMEKKAVAGSAGCAGRVWLVGAGPSDPGLLTLKGKQALERAEVVVYDALVGPGILQMIPEHAEAVNVGKRSGRHTMPQEEISALLVRKALEGRRVVRLKGGDPFLFGRGGEEAEELVKAGVPFEVVPGVTSAIAVPAYQGIPVTHRDYCSSVHIITGHRRSDGAPDIDFEALVRLGGTLVFLMGAASLGGLCRGLLEAGMRPDMPAALLMRGTTARQRRITASVESLEAEVKRRGGAKTPAVIVVGEVCALADQFAWYDRLPLAGARILLTRPREVAGETAEKLRELGAEVLGLPTAAVRRIPKNRRLQEALAHLDSYQWLVFTSRIGVRFFFEELREQRLDVRKLGQIRIAVIGSGTAEELEKHGLYADLVPGTYDGAHLGRALAEACNAGDRILIPRASAGNRALTDCLLEARRGLHVDDAALYDTVCGSDDPARLRDELQAGDLDYVLFTSASTVRGFAASAGDIDFTRIKAVCIGSQTREAAAALGMQTWVSEKATADSLIECVTELHRSTGNGNHFNR